MLVIEPKNADRARWWARLEGNRGRPFGLLLGPILGPLWAPFGLPFGPLLASHFAPFWAPFSAPFGPPGIPEMSRNIGIWPENFKDHSGAPTT